VLEILFAATRISNSDALALEAEAPDHATPATATD
jgi:hypothetical protein